MAEPFRNRENPLNPPSETPRQPVGLLPAESTSGSRLNHTAERVGSAVGNAIGAVRHLPEQLRQRFRVIRGGAAERAPAVRGRRAEGTVATAQRRLARAREIPREYPIQVILGAMGAAFVLAATLRIWRSRRG
jgi:hypothetical protein